MTEVKDINIPLVRDDICQLPKRRIRLNELGEVIGKLIEFIDEGDEVILYLSRYEREIMILSFFDEEVEIIRKSGLDKAIGKRVGILRIDGRIRIKKLI
ncbi:MAG TPA: hypothetical protein PKH80_03075 [Methanofastidiosum sp.]|nr:hypothetical protein [Methanofastidiosum sp.]HNU61943.1 hypothetical protein [Methanofastidiosum sp.]